MPALLAVFAVACLALASQASAAGLFVSASSDGSRVFFETSQRLVSADTDSSNDVYERSGGTTKLVSRGEVNGNGAFGATYDGSSTDGSRVFFHTVEQLASTDTDGLIDVYERSGGTTTQVSRGAINGNGANDASFAAASSDGTKVFFNTDEPLTGTDADTNQDGYERSGGTTTQVTQGASDDGDFSSGVAGTSSDGTKVFFGTSEPVESTDTDTVGDIYMRDTTGGTTTQVSQGAINGNGGDDASFEVASSDGAKVFFNTNEQLASTDADSSRDIYMRDLTGTPTTTQVSQGASDDGAFAATFRGATGDGSKVFFATSEPIETTDMDTSLELYARDTSANTTAHISQGLPGCQPGCGNGAFEVTFGGSSNDGSQVFFTTGEALDSADTDSGCSLGCTDLYVRSAGTTTWLSQGANGTSGVSFGGASGDGTQVFFDSGDKLAGTDTDGSTDVYKRSGGTTTQVSRGAINGNGPFSAGVPIVGPAAGVQGQISTDGTKAFFTTAEKLAGGDTDSAGDVYERSGGTTKLVSVEMISPQTTINGGPSGTTSDPTPSFSFASNEAGSSFQCKVDGGSFSACASPKTTAALSDGSHTFQVRATDAAGNLDATPASRTFAVVHPADTAAPDTSIDKGPKKKVKTKKKKAKVKFEFSSADLTAGFECSLDDAAFEPCTSPDKEKVKKGKHTFDVRAKDAAGNVDQSPAEQAFKVKRKKKK